MGKTTLYHPVSLHVIRGSADFGGFTFGKITQKWAFPDKGEARYDAEIVKLPDMLRDLGSSAIREVLQSCFMNDIQVHWVHQTKSGRWACQLQVELERIFDCPDQGGGGGGFTGDDDWDGLYLCSVCGDVYTQDDICHRCREQAMIDESVPSGILYHYCRDCGGSFPVEDLIDADMYGMLCERCFTDRRESDTL